jgi:UPF0271 protein
VDRPIRRLLLPVRPITYVRSIGPKRALPTLSSSRHASVYFVSIDLNADLGEGIGTDPIALDDALLAVVSSANIAAGGHAGDADSMARVCEQAAERRVAIGAHVSYVDREGFGRRPNNVDDDSLRSQILDQIAALDVAAQAADSAVTYIKAHGALYHRACIPGSREAEIIIDSALQFKAEHGRSLAILGFAGSDLIMQAREAGLKAANEAFADRTYTAEGWLVSRSEPNAVITDASQALTKLKRLLRDHEIIAIDGTSIEVEAQSICIHGDTPGAVVMARRLKAAIDADRVKVAPFAPPPKR